MIIQPKAVGLASFACALAAACGGRTTLDDPGAPGQTPGMQVSVTGDAGPDPCRSAVVAGAGRPMGRNCSTRDGRSRVTGPISPHVIWTTRISSGNFGALAADASGSVYVSHSLGDNLSDGAADGALLARVDGATGNVDWSTTFRSALSSASLLPVGGQVDFFASDPSGAGVIEQLEAQTGSTRSSHAEANDWALPQPAVGADGSLYAGTYSGVARLAADGTPSWTNGSLLPGGGGVSEIALGLDDLVLATVEPSGGAAALVALDPATGATRWTQTWRQGAMEDPIVRPDGSVVVLVGHPIGGASDIVVFEATGAVRAVIGVEQVGLTLVTISVVAQDGSFVLAGYDAARNNFLVDLTSTGELVWRAQVPGGYLAAATVDLRGTVMVAGPEEIRGLALTNGQDLWTLPAVDASPIVDATLTSSGGIVALEMDGTLFGAND
jgi:outer membrane protein assembly factor BamB